MSCYVALCIASDVILRHVITLGYAHVMLVYGRLYILLVDRMSFN